MKHRQEKIECWKCHEYFDFTVEIEETDTISVYCSFCYEESVIDFSPHKKHVETIFRGSDETDNIETNEYDFPDTIKGQKPPDKDT